MTWDYNTINSGDNNFVQRETGQQNESGTQTTTGSQSRSGSSRTTESFQQFNMSSAGRAALDRLIAQLAAGGTDAQRRLLEASFSEQQNLAGLRGEFSQERALALSEGLIQQSLEQAMRQALPQIALGTSAAGSSGDALSAILAQEAARGASVDAAALGAQQVAEFGDIQAAFSSVLENLITQTQDQGAEALLKALEIDVGSQQRGTRTSRTKSSDTQRSSSTTNTTGSRISSSTRTRTPGQDTSRVSN